MFNKYTISILNSSWVPLKRNLRVNIIPRKSELIYLEEEKQYFEVVNVIHVLNKKQDVFIIIESIEKQPNITT